MTKHTFTITWESKWTTDNLLEGDALGREAIRSEAVDLVQCEIDLDAHDLKVSIDGVVLVEA